MSRSCTGLFLHSANSLCAVGRWWKLQHIRVSAGAKGWDTVTVNRENMKCITEALLKCIFQLQMLTWALTFIVADSAVTLASNSWSSRKQTHSMGAELMSAGENHCWESVQLTASALLFSAVAPSPLAVASVLYPQRPKHTLALYSPPQCARTPIFSSAQYRPHYFNCFLSSRRGKESSHFPFLVLSSRITRQSLCLIS